MTEPFALDIDKLRIYVAFYSRIRDCSIVSRDAREVAADLVSICEEVIRVRSLEDNIEKLWKRINDDTEEPRQNKR